MPDPRQVRSMFGRVAGTYDLLNRALSLGTDQRWRRALVRASGDLTGRVALDVCSGTGDLAQGFARAGARAVAVDFTPEMLARAVRKRAAPRSRWRAPLHVQGDALHLPCLARSADVVGIAFGLRNLGDRARGLTELARVARAGGRVLVLEFSLPPNRALRALYRLYFTRVLPAVGRIVSRDPDAYAYLPRTVLAWPGPAELERELADAGLVDCGHRLLSGGIACLHWGRVPGGAGA